MAALLRTIKFNELAQRSGFTDFVHQVGVKTDADGAIAGVTKWFIRLIVLVVAFDAQGLPAVSDVLRQLPLWLPNLVVALVVLVAGGLAAQALSELVRAATAKAGFSNPGLLATIAGCGRGIRHRRGGESTGHCHDAHQHPSGWHRRGTRSGERLGLWPSGAGRKPRK